MIAVPTMRAAVLSGAFTPLQLPGLRLWLDASQIPGLADGDPVATWSDLSGNGFNATQATASKRPLFKTAIVNGRPVVRFDGVDDFMSVASLGLGAFSIYTVFRASGLALLYEHGPNANTTDGTYLATQQTGTIQTRRTTASQRDNGAHWADDNVWRIVGHVFDGTHAGHKLYVNGADSGATTGASSTDPGTATATNTLYLGARVGTSLFMAGDYYAALAYNAAHTVSQQRQFARYLSGLTGIAVS